MKLDIIDYADLADAKQTIKSALYNKGVVGIRNIPGYQTNAQTFIDALRGFCALDATAKQPYTRDRAKGIDEGYDLATEQFQNEAGEWLVDDKKASYYAYVPDREQNVWPNELDLQAPYLALANIMFNTGKQISDVIGMTKAFGLENTNNFEAHGRMLHYLKENASHTDNPNWCGGHFDHGGLTSLMPAYYYQNGEIIDEPQEAGLYVIPTGETEYQKIEANDKSVCLFQVGEFGQLASNDEIRATKHLVKKTHGNVERFTLAVFIDPGKETTINSKSVLSQDKRYLDKHRPDGSITYEAWSEASYDRYEVPEIA